jgi:hypothetical protein
MGYLFSTASSQYLSVAVSSVTYPFTMACWVYCASNSNDNGVAMALVDKTSDQHLATIYPFDDGDVYFSVKGDNDLVRAATVSYASATWLPMIMVCTSATVRDYYVGASTTNDTADTSTLTGLTTLLVGARWDATPSGPEKYFEGRVHAPVLDRGTAWDATDRAAYIAGTEGHKITGITPDYYKDLMRNLSSPADFGTAFTASGSPTVTDAPSVFTGQNKKQLTLTGTHSALGETIQTLMYDPDPGRTGADTLTILTTDATALTDSDNVSLTVAAAPPGAPWTQWELVPDSPIVYEHSVIDMGAIITFTPLVTFVGQGTATITEAHSDDDITYSSFAAITGEITARYLKIKCSVTDAFAHFERLDIIITAEIISEDLSDIDTSTLTGSTGDRRLALAKSYSLIKTVTPILQDVGAGWSYTVVDRNPTLGPRIKIYNASDTPADTTMDFVIRGIA